jgi:hypothetical protein
MPVAGICRALQAQLIIIIIIIQTIWLAQYELLARGPNPRGEQSTVFVGSVQICN